MVLAMMATPANSADLIVSTNDAKYVRVAGKDTFPENPGADTLSALDASTYPPRVVATVEVGCSIAGLPQAVAITPNGKLAVFRRPIAMTTRKEGHPGHLPASRGLASDAAERHR
jgi:hypothetical protein